MLDETIDEALTALQGSAPVYSGFGYDNLDNHGPMMAEAMVTLGRSDAVMPWVTRLVRELPAAPPPRQRIGVDWRAALGAGDRFGDWQIFFRDELAVRPWREVVASWIGRLSPGMASAGTHGVIRTAHAVRSLSVGETEARRDELADGLANWAAHYYELSGLPRRHGSLPPSEAVEHIPLAPPGRGTTGTRLRDLEQFAQFGGVGELVAARRSPDEFLAELTATFAQTYLASMRLNPSASTGLVHAVTVPSALRILLPYLRPADRRPAALYAWHTSAAIYATYGAATGSAEVDDSPPDRDDLIDRAVGLGNAHAVKFVEACWRAHDIDGDPLFPTAAARAVDIYEAQDR